MRCTLVTLLLSWVLFAFSVPGFGFTLACLGDSNTASITAPIAPLVPSWCDVLAARHPNWAVVNTGWFGGLVTAAILGAALPNQSLATSGLDIVVNSTYSGGRGTVVCEDHDYYGRRCARILHCGFLGCEEPAP